MSHTNVLPDSALLTEKVHERGLPETTIYSGRSSQGSLITDPLSLTAYPRNLQWPSN
jgi:hypothetical protein